MKHLILIMVVFLLLFSCKVKKETVITETRIDTVIVEKRIHDTIEKIVRVQTKPPQMNEIIIENPCDSITGKLREDISVRVGDGDSTLSVGNENNTLVINCFTKEQIDSVISEREIRFESEKEKIISKYEKSISEKTVKSKWTKWTYIFLLVSVLLLFILFSRAKKFFPTIF